MAFDPTSTLLPLQPQSDPPLPTAVDSIDPSPSDAHDEPFTSDGDPSLPRVGMEFDSPDAARSFYCAHAERVGFRVRNSKSFTSRVDDAVIMRRFVCSRQGRPSKKDPFDHTKKRRNRASSREGCRAMLQVNRRENGCWCVSRFVLEHCHPLGLTDLSPQKKLPTKPGVSLLTVPDPAPPRQNGLGPGGGVAQSLLEYFKRMQSDNPAFFYAIQLDRNNCIGNVFWADCRARMACNYFGDAVSFDMTCKRNKRAVPFVAFTGFNHHRQLINLGCAFMTEESEESFTWLFDTWCTLMSHHKPTSITTCYNESVESAVSRVFPDVKQRFCQRDIFSYLKERLSDVYSSNPGFKPELKHVVKGSENPSEFESSWRSLLERYNLTENFWLGFFYNIRHKWVPAFVKDIFFGEVFEDDTKPETMQKFFQRNSITTTTLRDLVTQFDKAMACQYEKELQADVLTTLARLVMKTTSPMEKQASEFYTRTIFEIFQEELVESSGFFTESFEEQGPISKYRVVRYDDANNFHVVTYNASEKILSCNCLKFEYRGIQCCHALRVLIASGELLLPEGYFLKRWGRNAKANEFYLNLASDWVNDLCRDTIRLAEEGATCQAVYKAAKSALCKALQDVCAAKNGTFHLTR